MLFLLTDITKNTGKIYRKTYLNEMKGDEELSVLAELKVENNPMVSFIFWPILTRILAP
jgi:hypothetical protein